MTTRSHASLAADAIIFVDDAHPEGEKMMLKRRQVEFPDFEQRDVLCEKGCKMVERHA